MLEFVYPWMFVLLPVPVFIYWLVPAYKQTKDSIQVPFFGKLVDITGEKPSEGAVQLHRLKFQSIMLVIAWILIVVAMAKPEWLGEPITRTKSARDLMVAVDLSGSMEHKDFTTSDGETINRLQAVKLVLHDFVEQRQHDRLGLIVFGDAAYLQAPFTEDHATWLTLLEETEIAMAGMSTLFGDAIGLAIKLFQQSETDNRVLIVLTDGNDTGSFVPPVEAAKVAEANDVTIYTIAIGDPETIGEEALDLDTLQRVAEITSGAYYQALDRKQLQDISNQILKIEPEQFETLSFSPRYPVHHYPLAFVVSIYLLFYCWMTAKSIRNRRLAND